MKEIPSPPEKPALPFPLEEEGGGKSAEPCILVIFGATGDLTARKLFPALYNLMKEGQLPQHFAVVGFARKEKSHEQFRSEMFEAISTFSRTKPIENYVWDSFKENIFYHSSQFDEDMGYKSLKTFLDELDRKLKTKGNRIYYFASQPSFFPVIVEKLKTHQLLYDTHITKEKWSRVIIEKPFGHDYPSAQNLQQFILKHLSENQLFRIDHYLGKETVQNILIFRFANSLFEAFWNNHYIDHVQITVAEDLGIGRRGAFWEEAGLVRDVVQNHMMQLLSLVTMEPPTSLAPDAIRDEKVKILQAIRPFDIKNLKNVAIRGQYGPGFIAGEKVIGYREEAHVSPTSNVETFAAFELNIDNWRWANVPFYLRAGKRLPKRATEIAIIFKEVPSILFSKKGTKIDKNVLTLRIQPNEGIALKINCKVPGPQSPIQPVKMDFSYSSFFGFSPPEAYERLILDAILNDSTLFARGDEVLTSWKLFTPLLNEWEEKREEAFPNYAAGTFGPPAADALLQSKGRAWKLV